MKLSLHTGSSASIFGTSTLLSIVALIAIAIFLGPAALLVSLVLIAVELAFSFDNAIINAKILGKMSGFWQQMFLTVGVVIAIFGMRVIFPMLIVMLTAHLPWHEVVNLALHNPKEYAEHLENAHPSISAFGGCFLLMLALHFFIDDNREVDWIKRIERPLRKYSRWWLPTVVTLVVLAILSQLPFNHHQADTIRAGLLGIGLYLVINLCTELIGRMANRQTSTRQTGLIALMTFMYLQVLDASFSFDGVIGAFAITNEVVLIAAGLGIGAIWVRSLTVFMVRRGTLENYIFLEHGAHYAVIVLALAMLLSLLIDIPEVITGTLGLGLIFASIIASRQARKQHA